MDLSRPTLARMFPRAIPEWLDALVTLAPELCERYQITTARRWVHFCGQVVAETAGLSIPHMRENMNYSAERLLQVFPRRVTPQEAGSLARRGPDAIAEHVYGVGTTVGKWLGNRLNGDGATFIGRGLMQTTGRDNYAKVGAEIGIDLVADPYKLEEPGTGVRAAFADWHAMGVNLIADRDDVVAVTKRVNGGTNGLDMRKAATARAKAIWGNSMVAVPVFPVAPKPVPVTTPSIPTPTLPPANDTAPPPIVAPAPPPEITIHHLAKGGSRTANLIIWFKRLIGIGGGASAFVATTAITNAKESGNALYGLVTDPTALMGIALFVFLGGFGLLAEHYFVAAAKQQRYWPTGWLAATAADIGSWAGFLAEQMAGDGSAITDSSGS